ncbi:hypothetical protein [Streptomyces sp. JJ38]|uniref:non-homologous end-joining DNA ligase LigD n=1 Tax=Streptomyces sp. JJ38 TaxID=2738128 RepID=UPI0035B43236
MDRPDHPDRLSVDLDLPGDDFAAVRRAERWLRELLTEPGLPSRVMSTGSRGLHVLVPLDRRADSDAVRPRRRPSAGPAAGGRPSGTDSAPAPRGGGRGGVSGVMMLVG